MRNFLARSLNAWQVYLATRCSPKVVFVLPLLIIATIVCVSPQQIAGMTVWLNVTTALLFIVGWRIWDDLADRRDDCRRDPARVTCDERLVVPLVVLTIIAQASGLMIVVGTHAWRTLLGVLAIQVILAIWYSCRGRLGSVAVLNAHVVLGKYPALASSIAVDGMTTAGARGFVAPAILYLVLCIHEYWHDERVRKARWAKWLVICEFTAVLTLLGALVAVH